MSSQYKALDNSTGEKLTPLISPKTKLCDVSSKDKPWDMHRAFSDSIADLYFDSYGADGYDSYLKMGVRVMECAQTLAFVQAMDESSNPSLVFRQTRFCRVRHCSICQWRRSLYWKARMYSALPELSKMLPGGRWIFLTLTLRNCFIGDLKKRVASMNQSFNRLIRRKEFKPVKGWVKSLEVTRSPDGTAHPHFHVLLFVSSTYFKPGYYLSQASWTELWKSCARVDYDPIVDVRAVKDKGEKGLTGAVAETLKYSVKATDLLQDRHWFLEYTKQMHGVRAIGTGGILKGVFKEEPEEEDLLLQDEGEGKEEQEEEQLLLFDWNHKKKHYIKGL